MTTPTATSTTVAMAMAMAMAAATGAATVVPTAVATPRARIISTETITTAHRPTKATMQVSRIGKEAWSKSDKAKNHGKSSGISLHISMTWIGST